METLQNEKVREAVRETYGNVAKTENGASCGCGSGSDNDKQSLNLGYTKDNVSAVPQGANMGLGCGNPQAIASLKTGETVIDLGSGGGFDCFLAAQAVGKKGRVIGVDMTPEMIEKARRNAKKTGSDNVEFHLGNIEKLPVADNTADVIISNCVINLSPEKEDVFDEAHRVLKKGGRLAITDIIAVAPIPEAAQKDLALHSGCMSGAASKEGLELLLEKAGFTNVRIKLLGKSKEIIKTWEEGGEIQNYVASATIEAIKS